VHAVVVRALAQLAHDGSHGLRVSGRGKVRRGGPSAWNEISEEPRVVSRSVPLFRASSRDARETHRRRGGARGRSAVQSAALVRGVSRGGRALRRGRHRRGGWTQPRGAQWPPICRSG
jgi:hypothetical protein